MIYRAVSWTLMTGVLLVTLVFCSPVVPRETISGDSVFQVSTLQALFKGVYDGDFSYEEVMKHGDFGLGTFNALDGEMVAVEGIFYRVDYYGNANAVDPSRKTPFVTVKHFKPDMVLEIRDSLDYKEFKTRLDSWLKTKNKIYAIKVHGTFKSIKARSVPRLKKPYPPIEKVIKDQSIINFADVKGTLVGFRMPAFMNNINQPGYHFHFITDDRQKGGHALDFIIENALVEIDEARDFRLIIPGTKDFQEADFYAE